MHACAGAARRTGGFVREVVRTSPFGTHPTNHPNTPKHTNRKPNHFIKQTLSFIVIFARFRHIIQSSTEKRYRKSHKAPHSFPTTKSPTSATQAPPETEAKSLTH
jgi:hypothetical protein